MGERLSLPMTPHAAARGTGPRSPVGVDPESGSVPGGVLAVLLSWTGDGRCINAPAAGPTGALLPATGLQGDGWLDALHADSRALAAESLDSVLGGGAAREEAVRLAGPDRWAVLRIRPLTPGAGALDAEGTPQPAAGGVLVDATRSLGATARLARLVEGFNRLRSPLDIVAATLDAAVGMLGGRTASLHVLSDAGDELVIAGDTGVPADVVAERFGRIPLSSPLPAAEAMRTGRPVVSAPRPIASRAIPRWTSPASRTTPPSWSCPCGTATAALSGSWGSASPRRSPSTTSTP